MFWLTGVVRDGYGQPPTGPIQLLVSIYQDADGGIPLVREIHAVTLDAEGRYGVLLGSTLADGLPLDAFSTDEARWIGGRPAGRERERTFRRIALIQEGPEPN